LQAVTASGESTRVRANIQVEAVTAAVNPSQTTPIQASVNAFVPIIVVTSHAGPEVQRPGSSDPFPA